MPPVASVEAVVAAETLLEFSFPSLLRSLYLAVGNGGFGPGYGVIGVEGGHKTDEGDSIEKLYESFCTPDADDKEWKWPKGLLPFCHWGCAIYSCVNINEVEYPVIWFDPNGRELGEPMAKQFNSHRPSLESWFAGWLNNEDLWAETYGAI